VAAGVIVSSLISSDEMQQSRQIVTPSLWQEESSSIILPQKQ
jgi:hypothetical protein